MKSILIAFLLIAAVGCSYKRSLSYKEIAADFDILMSKGNAHMAAGNFDSAIYYSGQMHYNIELRRRITNK